MENKTKKHSLKISSNSASKKPKIRINFDKYFDNVEKENIVDSSAEKESPKNIIQLNDSFPDFQSSQTRSTGRNQNAKKVLADEDLIQMATHMFAIAQIVTKQLKSACETVHTYRTKSSLGICGGDIAEQDVPWFTLFQNFNLPMKSKEEVEALEQELEKSSDFLRFFVRLNFPMLFFIFGRKFASFFVDLSHCTDREESLSISKIDIGRFYLFIDVKRSHSLIQMEWTYRKFGSI